MQIDAFKISKSWTSVYTLTELLAACPDGFVWFYVKNVFDENESSSTLEPVLLFKDPRPPMYLSEEDTERYFIPVTLSEDGLTAKEPVLLSVSTIRDFVSPLTLEEAIDKLYHTANERWLERVGLPLDYGQYQGPIEGRFHRCWGVTEGLQGAKTGIVIEVNLLNTKKNPAIPAIMHYDYEFDFNSKNFPIWHETLLQGTSSVNQLGRILATKYDRETEQLTGLATFNEEGCRFIEKYDGNLVLSLESRTQLLTDKRKAVIKEIISCLVVTNQKANRFEHAPFPGIKGVTNE